MRAFLQRASLSARLKCAHPECRKSLILSLCGDLPIFSLYSESFILSLCGDLPIFNHGGLFILSLCGDLPMVNYSYFPCVVIYLYLAMVNHSYFPCVVIYLYLPIVNQSYFPCVVIYLYLTMVNHSYFPCVVIYLYLAMVNHSYFPCVVNHPNQSSNLERTRLSYIYFVVAILAHSFRPSNLGVLMYGVDKLGCHIVEPVWEFSLPREVFAHLIYQQLAAMQLLS